MNRTKIKHVHVLAGLEGSSKLDLWFMILSLSSRGRHIIQGRECRSARDNLAEEFIDGPLAELLRSGRPIRVGDCARGVRLEEV